MNLVLQLLTLGLVAGIAGGMFGIGGGAIMVPVMVLMLGMDQKLATGTSLGAQVLPVAILGAMEYHRNGNLKLADAVYLAAGLLLGNLLGAMFANQPYVSPGTMKKLYGGFLVLIGLRYLFDPLFRARPPQ